MTAPPEIEYHSESDEDFIPDAQPVTEAEAYVSSSESERETGPGRPSKRKSAPTGDVEDIGFENSGDEVTLKRGRKKRKASLDKDEVGEGGLVKTRAQRRLEEREKKPLSSTDEATVDVDALWASMNAKAEEGKDCEGAVADPQIEHGVRSGSVPEDGLNPHGQPRNGADTAKQNIADTGVQDAANVDSEQDVITIKRTYEFAGELITEERKVPKGSAEARLYLEAQSQRSQPSPTSTLAKPPLRRPKKRASMFEPSSPGPIKGISAAASKGPKLNTVEKSKLDWAGYVDKEGIANELQEHKKGKEGYLGRMDFLSRMDEKRDSGPRVT